MENRRLKVAIVGGGIGGLSFALALAKLIPNVDSHLEVDIYESTSSLKAQVGAGIGVWPFAWAIMETLGLDKELVKYTTSIVTDEPVDLLRLRKADQPDGQTFFKMRTSSGAIIFFHRGDFQKVLLDHVPSSMKIHTKKRLRSYTQHATGVELQFEDGTTTNADVVIGADGLQSRVRKTMMEELSKKDPNVKHLAEPNWTGLLTYRALIPRQKFLDSGWDHHPVLSGWTVYSGKTAAFMSYPVSKGANINFVGFRLFPEFEGSKFEQEILEEQLRKEGYTRTEITTDNVKAIGQDPVVSNEVDPWAENGGGGRTAASRARWVAKVSPEEVKHSFQGWEPEALAVINAIDTPLAWAVHKVGPLNTFINGRVCLLGDAAHAMQPSHGVGAGQGIYDSYILAILFAAAVSADPSRLHSRLSTILETYDAVRLPGVEIAATGSRDAAFFYMGRIRDGRGNESWKTVDPNNEQEVKMLQEQLTAGYQYAWDKPMALRDAELARKMFLERIAPKVEEPIQSSKRSKGVWRKVLKWVKSKAKPNSVRHEITA